MTDTTEKQLERFHQLCARAEVYQHAGLVLEFDKETICPPLGMEEQGEISAEMMSKAYALTKRKDYIKAMLFLHDHLRELDSYDRALVETQVAAYQKNRQITPAMNHRFALIYNSAFVAWLKAKQCADFSVFLPALKKVREAELKKIALRQDAEKVPYDNLLDDYERGMREAQLDDVFGRCLDRLVPLLQRIRQSQKKIRTDFMSRKVTRPQQEEMTRYLLGLLGFDAQRGAWTTSEHPFTEILGKNDIRVTTHFYEDQFASSMYSIIHECGHALFEQLQPKENFTHYLNNKTMGQHESVSRFYENRIGRSESFVHLIYPKAKEIFPQVLSDVTERELYEALNLVQPSLIRTEADEFTYTFHIIIRYELEKAIIDDRISLENLPQLWNDKYASYLSVRPGNDREGVLQDMHWTSGFGYFTAYALGNLYNAMYYNRMAEELDIDHLVAAGRIGEINDWMQSHVFAQADRLDPQEWLKQMTGKTLSPDAFLDYLEQKYTAIYQL